MSVKFQVSSSKWKRLNVETFERFSEVGDD